MDLKIRFKIMIEHKQRNFFPAKNNGNLEKMQYN